MTTQLKRGDVRITFSDYFDVSKEKLAKEGFFDISLVSDLPVFIDPFLLFYSKNTKYQKLHKDVINYLLFLKDKSEEFGHRVPVNHLRYYFTFPEISQNWFGFTFIGNEGHGLGLKFAFTLSRSFQSLFENFGGEKISKSSHLEKLCLVARGVGRDTISDFTTNLIKGFLLKETERFAKKHVHKKYLREFIVQRVHFNYKTQRWEGRKFILPILRGNYVLLTPRDLLTRDEAWINKEDFFSEFELLPPAIPDEVLRTQLMSYFNRKIQEYSVTKKNEKGEEKRIITQKNRRRAILETTEEYPVVIEYFICRKERLGDKAVGISQEKVGQVESIFETQYRNFLTDFANLRLSPLVKNSYQESLERAKHMKHWIELQDGYKNLYINDTPVDEEWVQRMFWPCWFGSISDLNREVSNGRGKVDFTVSQGRRDKTAVEFKLANSSSLKVNLQEQLELYKKVNQTEKGVWIIIYFSAEDAAKAKGVLSELGMTDAENVVLIDARKDNKPSASKIKAKKDDQSTK